VNARDHSSYRDEVGAYMLGALTELEQQAYERHLAGCSECRNEIELLRPATEALARSVEQVDPPAGLKTTLMEVVEREASERSGDQVRRRPPLSARLRGLFAPLRPALAAGALALGLLAGFGVAQLADDEPDTRTVTATVDESRLPMASARLQIPDGGEDGAILEVQGMPSLDPNQRYQAWVQRDGTLVPQPTFEVGADGGGAVALPEDISDAQAVLVTREARGGARAPTEQPILSVPL
jgi:Anti-sigma-K factor rskA/Putative zinc-finger